MNRPPVYNFFFMDTPSHFSHGAWRMPDNRSTEYNTLDLWVGIAKLAEENKLDGIFFADVLGLYETQGKDWGKMVRHAVQFPVSDPMMVLSAMAYATKDVGLMCTRSVLQTHPFEFARAAATFDHLSNGRFGWNIVCGASKNGARCMGLPDTKDHATRYAWAEEYVSVTYKLWEASWDEGAVVKDGKNQVYADPNKVHKVNHKSERYSVEGPLDVEPSPQRVPVIFQAGGSGPGVAFAAQHTEGAFLISGNPEAAKGRVASMLAEAVKAGRRKEDLHFIEGIAIITGATDEEALAKEAEIEANLNDEAQSLMYMGATGIDLSAYDPDTPLEDLLETAPGMRGGLKLAIDSVKDRKAVVRDLIRGSTRNYRVVGGPDTVANRIQEFLDVGITGFNLLPMTVPGSAEDFCKYVAPELRKRGLMQTEYRPGTLREKMFPGNGPYLNERHPGFKYRNSIPEGMDATSHDFP